jgi:hypothetical protein
MTQHLHHASVAPSPAWLSSIITNMTQYLHHAVAKSSQQRRHQHDSATSLSTWLDIYIAPRLTSPRQHHHRYDSTVPSPEGLDSTVVGMNWYLHRAAAKSPWHHHRQHDSTAISHNNMIVNINDIWLQWQVGTLPAHTVQVTMAAPSLARLSSDITQQLDRQRQRHMTSAASMHVASSYRHYSQLCLVSGLMQASRCATWHLRKASNFWRFIFEDFKL